jgi:MtN3 and saliva related transmembrane protein
MSDTLAVIAAAWGVMMAVSPLLQIRRMLETRSSADFSLGYLVVLLIGFGLWAAYGLSLGNLALIVPNSTALVIGLITMAVALRFRRPVAP